MNFIRAGPERLAIVADAGPLMGLPLAATMWIEAVLKADTAFAPDRTSLAAYVPLHRCLRTVVERSACNWSSSWTW